MLLIYLQCIIKLIVYLAKQATLLHTFMLVFVDRDQTRLVVGYTGIPTSFQKSNINAPKSHNVMH